MLYRLGIPWGIYRDVYSLSHFTTYPLSTGQSLVGTVGVLTNLISLGIFLKCLEDTSEEVNFQALQEDAQGNQIL